MRLDFYYAPFLLTFLLPLLVSVLDLGPITVIVAMTTALLTHVGLRKPRLSAFGPLNSKSSLPVLETVTASPYAEKVRWCLDLLAIKYEEQPDVGLLGRILVGRQVPTLHFRDLTIGNSSDILYYLKGCVGNNNNDFFVTTEESDQLERDLDNYAFNFRSFTYLELMEDKQLLFKYWGGLHQGIPTWQKTILRLFLTPFTNILRVKLDIGRAQSLQALRDAQFFMRLMDQKLSDGRNFLLKTDMPTYIDVVFAALAGAHVYPDNFHGHENRKLDAIPTLDEMPTAYRKEVLRFRATRAGKFVLRMYKLYR